MQNTANAASDASVRETKGRMFLLATALSCLIFLSMFAKFLAFQGYSYVAPESLLIFVGLVGIGFLCGALMVFLGTVGRVLIVTALVTILVDYAFDWQGYGIRGRYILPLIFVTALVVAWLVRRHLLLIGTTVFAVVFTSTILFPLEARQESGIREAVTGTSPGIDEPVIIHLVLDGHIGIEGIPTDIPGGADIKRFLKTFYAGHGFRLFGRAFSRYSGTGNTIPNLLNLSAPASDGVYSRPRQGKLIVTENRYFEALRKMGYRIQVYQSDAIDFCNADNARVDACFTYRYTSLQWIREVPIPVSERVWLLANGFAKNSTIYYNFARIYNERGRPLAQRAGLILPVWNVTVATHAPLSVVAALKLLRDDVVIGPRGTLYFAHVLLPHGPYPFDRDCRIRPSIAEWLVVAARDLPWPYRHSLASRSGNYALYFAQVACLYKELDAFFRDIEAADHLSDAIIFVHGDHGSQLSLIWPGTRTREQMSRQDYIDVYSTLVAVRGPGLEPGYDLRLRALDSLFGETVATWLGVPDVSFPDDARIFLTGSPMGSLTETDMPAFGSTRE